MYPGVTEESIKYGIISQNLNSIGEFRIEYLGQTIDINGEVNEELLVTELDEEIHTIKELKNFLSEFITCLVEENLPEEMERIPSMSFSPVETEELRYFNRVLAGRIDWEWFPEGIKALNLKETESDMDNLFNRIKILYYDYHLEYLLEGSLRKAYDEYRKQTEPDIQLNEEQQEKFEEATIIANLSQGELPDYQLRSNSISYGKYRDNLYFYEVYIPGYGANLGIDAELKDYALYKMKHLKKIWIYDEINYFGKSVFGDCINLECVYFGSEIKEIPEDTFFNCSSLAEVNIPSSVRVIGRYAFERCINLKTLTLQDGLKKIEKYAFCNSGLVEISIPDSVISIGYGAFENCRELKSIEFPAAMKEITLDCMEGCNNLLSVRYRQMKEIR
jgi:hypothetical protein